MTELLRAPGWAHEQGSGARREAPPDLLEEGSTHDHNERE